MKMFVSNMLEPSKVVDYSDEYDHDPDDYDYDDDFDGYYEESQVQEESRRDLARAEFERRRRERLESERRYREYHENRANRSQPVQKSVRGTVRTARTAAVGSERTVYSAVDGTAHTVADVAHLRPFEAVAGGTRTAISTAYEAGRTAVTVPVAAVEAVAGAVASVVDASRHVFDDEHYERHIFDDDPYFHNASGKSSEPAPSVPKSAPELIFCGRASDCLGCSTCMPNAGGKACTNDGASKSAAGKKACGCATCSIARTYRAQLTEFEEAQKASAGKDDVVDAKQSGAKENGSADVTNSLAPTAFRPSAMFSNNVAPLIAETDRQCKINPYNAKTAKGAHGKQSGDHLSPYGVNRGNHKVNCQCDRCLSGACADRKSSGAMKKSGGKNGHRAGCNCPKCADCGCGCCGYPDPGQKSAKGCHGKSKKASSYSGGKRQSNRRHTSPLSGARSSYDDLAVDAVAEDYDSRATTRTKVARAGSKFSKMSINEEQAPGKIEFSINYYDPPLAGSRCVFCDTKPMAEQDCHGCKQTIYNPPAL